MASGSAPAIEVIEHGSAVPEGRQGFLLERIESIMASNWHFTRRHWSREDSPFHDDYAPGRVPAAGSQALPGRRHRSARNGHATFMNT